MHVKMIGWLTAVVAAAAAAAMVGALSGCSKSQPPAGKKGADPQSKAIVLPANPLTDAEKAALFKAAKGFVEAAQAKEPKAYTDIDWRTVEFKRMGIYFHIKVEKTKFTPHTQGVSPVYVFRTDKAMQNVIELTAQQ